MENRDLELIEKFSPQNKILAELYHKHLEYEHLIEKYNHKPYLTPMEETERKNLQKMKLVGRDRIEGILREYRKSV